MKRRTLLKLLPASIAGLFASKKLLAIVPVVPPEPEPNPCWIWESKCVSDKEIERDYPRSPQFACDSCRHGGNCYIEQLCHGTGCKMWYGKEIVGKTLNIRTPERYRV